MSYIQYVTADNHHVEDPLPDLARTNRFTVADLEQNRNGKISDAQWARLFRRALEPVRYTGGALLGWLLCCAAVKFFVPGIILFILALAGAKILTVLFGAITLACAGAFVLSLVKSAGTMALLMVDLNTGAAACIEGRVSASREDERGLGMARVWGEKHTHHWYVVKNEYFVVDQEAHGALPEGRQFRLYYTPKSKLLLSLEPPLLKTDSVRPEPAAQSS